MDPNATFETVLTSDDYDERLAAAINLLVWLAKGGATPVGYGSRTNIIDDTEGILLDLLEDSSKPATQTLTLKRNDQVLCGARFAQCACGLEPHPPEVPHACKDNAQGTCMGLWYGDDKGDINLDDGLIPVRFPVDIGIPIPRSFVVEQVREKLGIELKEHDVDEGGFVLTGGTPELQEHFSASCRFCGKTALDCQINWLATQEPENLCCHECGLQSPFVAHAPRDENET